MRVLEDRQHQAAVVAAARGVEALRPLHPPPAVVLAAAARGGLEVDLLDGVLADVADVEVARAAVEAEAPGVAQAGRPDLGRAAAPGERIVRRDRVRRLGVDVDPQQLAEQRVLVLAVVLRVAAVATMASAMERQMMPR